MDSNESLLPQLIRELRALLLEQSGALPLAMTKRRAARELDISPRKLASLIRRGEIQTCRIGGREHIPRSEVLRVAEPETGRPKSSTRRSNPSGGPGRSLPRAKQKAAKSLAEAEAIRALIKRKD